MKSIAVCVFLMISSIGMAQNKYEQGMERAFQLWDADQSVEAANLFERIAQAELDNWLPAFYVAQINILNSFNEKDEATLTDQLQKAKMFIDRAKEIEGEHPELLVLEAQMYTAWVVFDGQKYGMSYSPKIAQLYSKAQTLAPNNPRVVLGKAEWDMGSARFFGKPITPYCAEIERAIELFTSFEPESKFHPDGGAKHAEELLARTCNN
ncbi:MAG: hypothetical protein HKM28_04700 [Flavobacteriaceae bacterium]|nr:hypothetical protein [Flavobacteriaceae bacterium]